MVRSAPSRPFESRAHVAACAALCCTYQSTFSQRIITRAPPTSPGVANDGRPCQREGKRAGRTRGIQMPALRAEADSASDSQLLQCPSPDSPHISHAASGGSMIVSLTARSRAADPGACSPGEGPQVAQIIALCLLALRMLNAKHTERCWSCGI